MVDEDFKKKMEENEKEYNRFRTGLSSIITDVDRELAENSLFRY
jgi:hypothetical protein